MREIARRLMLALYKIDEIYYMNEGKKKLAYSELCVMYALDDGKPHSQREISQEWLVPKTTVNTIVKTWEKEGLLTLTPIPDKRREKYIILTESGREYAKEFMGFIYRAEEKALKRTLDKYSDEFIKGLEFFGESLKEAFDEEFEKEEADKTDKYIKK
ncbi:MarR family transcriptional regulator [Peptacetobacter hiranonis]|uniref:MarR family winged helix-turn-helix transcriptional regulator n=1 Tax=Peptacetobacter hiranonis TaxID=89152 RepID=UPI001916CE36|nr:MarR family transcriptional regulator [Peptacetobacter hiranonis]QQQ86431.1 MarR family transcriptional regulator [Peptacetobacter hiranonis]